MAVQAAQADSIALVGDAEIQGTCNERFAAVQEAFATNLNTGTDIGASVAPAVFALTEHTRSTRI